MWTTLAVLLIHKVIHKVIHKFVGAKIDLETGSFEGKNEVADVWDVVKIHVYKVAGLEPEVDEM